MMKRAVFAWSLVTAGLLACPAFAQTAREVLGAAAVESLQNEPLAKIVIDPPLVEPLSHGRAVIQYRTENLHVVPLFGPAALAVSPRIGHIHVTVDDAAWHWADASGDPIIINGLAPGPRKILIQLVNAWEISMKMNLINENFYSVHHEPNTTGCIIECMPDIIRKRAYQLFEAGGRRPNHELEDWLQAEREVKHHFGSLGFL